MSSSVFRSPLLSLANVEAALCLHGLTVQEILLFARCCVRTMEMASTAFAFQRTSPLRISLRVLLDSLAPLPLEGRLLKHAPFALVCTGALFSGAGYRMLPADFSCLLDRLPPRLHEIDATEWFGLDSLDSNVRSDRWLTLLAHPACHSLRSLTLHQTLLDLAAVFRLPLLHSFRTARALPITDWATVAQAPSLTRLALVDKQFTSQSRLEYIAASPTLRHLELSHPSLGADNWRTFFDTPQMQLLESLRLDNFNTEGEQRPRVQLPVPDADFARAFAALTHLSTLYLKQVAAIDRMLPHVALASALRTLMIEPRCGLGAETHPAGDMLRSTLANRPEMHCTLVLPFPSDTPAIKMQSAIDTLQELYRVSARKSLGCDRCSAALGRSFGDSYRVYYFHLSSQQCEDA